MGVNENEFFRQATLRICSSLDIEKALLNCLSYVSTFVPASEMYLTLYEPGLGVLRNLACATLSGRKRPFPPTPMPKEAIRLIEDTLKTDQFINIEQHPERDPIAKNLFGLSEVSKLSIMIMVLVVEGKGIGAIGIISEGKRSFTDDHVHLISLLREPFAIATSNAIRYQEIIKLKDMVDAENRELHQELRYPSAEEIVGAEFGLKGIMEMIRQVAPTDSPAMLLGETGVGKEVIANAIHQLSHREECPFITVNCGAIPDSLVDSELFGHEKGAFTGAIAQKRGRFERAHKGSIFLDEIGDLPLHAQTRLLRVLQNKEIERVGGSGPINVDVRIIAATNRNIEALLASGQFREDLWYRLNIFPIMIPPLRHRKEDVPALVHHFINKKCTELKIHTPPAVVPETIEAVKAYSWPGNVRELENMVERALIQTRGQKQPGPLYLDHFPFPESKKELHASPGSNHELLTLNDAVSRHIQRALQQTVGKIYGTDGAAQLLGVNPNTLRSKMRKLKIPFGRYQGR